MHEVLRQILTCSKCPSFFLPNYHWYSQTFYSVLPYYKYRMVRKFQYLNNGDYWTYRIIEVVRISLRENLKHNKVLFSWNISKIHTHTWIVKKILHFHISETKQLNLKQTIKILQERIRERAVFWKFHAKNMKNMSY